MPAIREVRGVDTRRHGPSGWVLTRARAAWRRLALHDYGPQPGYPSPMATHARPPQLPADNHVHSEWSWDAEAGAMEASCARAAALGIPAIAFTEHWDPTPCPIDPAAIPHLPPLIRGLVSPEGVFRAPALDVE